MFLLSRRRRRVDLDGVNVTYDGHTLPRSSKVKCLGVVIDEDLSWRNHVDHIRRKCFSALSVLRRHKDVMPFGMQRK